MDLHCFWVLPSESIRIVNFGSIICERAGFDCNGVIEIEGKLLTLYPHIYTTYILTPHIGLMYTKSDFDRGLVSRSGFTHYRFAHLSSHFTFV